jgi:hypothetical protein
MGSYKKYYRWQCKLFDSPQEATDFVLTESKKNDAPGITLLIENTPIVPKILEPWMVGHKICNYQKSNVDILE